MGDECGADGMSPPAPCAMRCSEPRALTVEPPAWVDRRPSTDQPRTTVRMASAPIRMTDRCRRFRAPDAPRATRGMRRHERARQSPLRKATARGWAARMAKRTEPAPLSRLRFALEAGWQLAGSGARHRKRVHSTTGRRSLPGPTGSAASHRLRLTMAIAYARPIMIKW